MGQTLGEGAHLLICCQESWKLGRDKQWAGEHTVAEGGHMLVSA